MSMGGKDKGIREQEVLGGAEKVIWVIFGGKIGDDAQGSTVKG